MQRGHSAKRIFKIPFIKNPACFFFWGGRGLKLLIAHPYFRCFQFAFVAQCSQNISLKRFAKFCGTSLISRILGDTTRRKNTTASSITLYLTYKTFHRNLALTWRWMRCRTFSCGTKLTNTSYKIAKSHQNSEARSKPHIAIPSLVKIRCSYIGNNHRSEWLMGRCRLFPKSWGNHESPASRCGRGSTKEHCRRGYCHRHRSVLTTALLVNHTINACCHPIRDKQANTLCKILLKSKKAPEYRELLQSEFHEPALSLRLLPSSQVGVNRPFACETYHKWGLKNTFSAFARWI